MTIYFYYADGSYKILRPSSQAKNLDINSLMHDFQAIKFEIK